MAEIRHAINGGLAEVSDEQAKVLIESGQWVAVKAAPVKKAAPAAKVHAEASSKLEG